MVRQIAARHHCLELRLERMCNRAAMGGSIEIRSDSWTVGLGGLGGVGGGPVKVKS